MRNRVSAALAGADAEVVMQARLLLVPVLLSVAGCSDTIDAQESEMVPVDTAASPESAPDTAQTPGESHGDLKLQPPVGLD